MGHSAAYYWKGKIPASQFFTAIPFGMNAQEVNSWLHYGGGMKLWQEFMRLTTLSPLLVVTQACKWQVGLKKKSIQLTI